MLRINDKVKTEGIGELQGDIKEEDITQQEKEQAFCETRL